MRAVIYYLLARVRPGRPLGKRGQTLVEYSILLAMVSIMAIGVFTALGQRIVLVFSSINDLLDTAQASH